MLKILYQDLELRLSGSRSPEAGPSNPKSNPTSPAAPLNPMGMAMGIGMGMGMGIGMGMSSNPPIPSIPRDGVCFSNLAHRHGTNLKPEEDEHGLCICQLVTCMACFHETAINRKGPISALPFELDATETSIGWVGSIETQDQARVRRQGLRMPITPKAALPSKGGVGWVQNVKPEMVPRPVPMFPHPQMTDVLAVEEHLRWRLKEMGAIDPAVESRYGPSMNSSVALEGIELPDEEEEGSVKGMNGTKGNGKVVKVTKGRGKVRRAVNGGIPPKKEAVIENGKKGKICYLPKEWVDEEPSERNMAIILTFRHFVKVSHNLPTLLPSLN